MAALTKPIFLLSVSFALFLMAPPLISIGTTGGPRVCLWLGLAALGIAGLIPPVQRLLTRPKTQGSKNAPDESAD